MRGLNSQKTAFFLRLGGRSIGQKTDRPSENVWKHRWKRKYPSIRQDIFSFIQDKSGRDKRRFGITSPFVIQNRKTAESPAWRTIPVVIIASDGMVSELFVLLVHKLKY